MPARARRCSLLLVAALLALACVVPAASADDRGILATPPRISAADPLNGGFLLVNMHGMLFHPLDSDIQEDVAYARWLGSGIIRVFATDNNGFQQWNGAQVGSRIANVAPILRAAHVRLVVALVNNHRAVPGEPGNSFGWMDNYWQLLLPFYTNNWRGAYLQFVRDLVGTVQARGAQDVIFAWELGNELHTPQQPNALVPFVISAVEQVRALDPITPILPGTMGANHVEPGNAHSPIARWLYCDAPFDAYTLHAYDWVSRQRPGDMPIDWDLDNIISEPCANGRNLPVIVEELGTSRSLPGVYSADDERGRLQQELRQIQFVRRFPQVVGFGVWNGESPRLDDRTFFDTRRGLTSYGPNVRGGGSCYDPLPDPAPGVRCQLEQALRGFHFLRVDTSSQWTPGSDADPTNPLLGQIDPVYSDEVGDSLAISGWMLDPTATESTGVDSIDVLLGDAASGATRLATARLGLARSDIPGAADNPNFSSAGFTVTIPLSSVPVGLSTVTLVAHSPEHGSWLSTLQVVVPTLGAVLPARSVPPVVLAPLPVVSTPQAAVEIQAPQPGDSVGRTFIMQLLAPSADRVDVFLEPGRDQGGRLVGSASVRQLSTTPFRITVSLPPGNHTLSVHAQSTVTGREKVVPLNVVAT
jgi:hypothetical protein